MAIDRSSPRDEGFTLVELLVAMLVLAICASSVASLVGTAARALVRPRLETTAVLAAQDRLEQLRSLAWGFGSADLPGAGVDVTTSLSADEPGPGGTGLTGSPAGTLDVDTAGFVDYLDPSGTWIAQGNTPSPGTRFIRRWSIGRDAAFPDAIVVSVRVIDRRGEVRDVLLSTLRTRTAA